MGFFSKIKETITEYKPIGEMYQLINSLSSELIINLSTSKGIARRLESNLMFISACKIELEKYPDFIKQEVLAPVYTECINHLIKDGYLNLALNDLIKFLEQRISLYEKEINSILQHENYFSREITYHIGISPLTSASGESTDLGKFMIIMQYLQLGIKKTKEHIELENFMWKGMK